MKVFLGGTCNQSRWRDELIPQLKIDYFNPIVPTWTEEAYEQELVERATCDYCLYVITPRAKGFYSIAEVCVYLATIPVPYVRRCINSFDVHKTTWIVFKMYFVVSYIQILVKKFVPYD